MEYTKIFEKLCENYSFIYLANDVYQGTGPEFFLKNYNIATFDYNPLVDLVRKNTNVFTLEESANNKNQTFRNSANLTEFPEIINYVNSLKGKKKILVFKNSASLELSAHENNWEICAAQSENGRYFENKLKSAKYFQELGLNSPKNKIIKADKTNLDYKTISNELGKKFVIQLAKGFAGAHTYIISTEQDLIKILPRIIEREVKISEFIEGLTITINACVTSHGTIVSSPFLQITGISECTKNKAGATGNQWGDLPIPADDIRESTFKVGEYMRGKNYRGIFGLDLIVTQNDKIYFIENNARLVNSIPFFTQLQINSNEIPLSAIHLLEFTNKIDSINLKDLSFNYSNDIKGSQLILHNLEDNPIEIKADLKPGIYNSANNKLTFIKSTYQIKDCKNENEYLILCKEKGRIINSNMEIARIQTPLNLVDQKGNLLSSAGDLGKIISLWVYI